jgi:phosphatidylglycerophosphate synthase
VTLFTAIPGIVVALLFLNGWLRLGTLLAYAVAILDGVDGKLARTKLQTSRFGELEHILDFIMEQAWYLAITIFLATSTGKHELWWIGGGLMTCDLLDKSLYGLGHFFLDKHLDELGLFDRRFRLIGGRRNIYLWLFTVGFWAGVPTQTCVFVLVWALCTVVVHSSRLVHHIGKRAITA